MTRFHLEINISISARGMNILMGNKIILKLMCLKNNFSPKISVTVQLYVATGIEVLIDCATKIEILILMTLQLHQKENFSVIL